MVKKLLRLIYNSSKKCLAINYCSSSSSKPQLDVFKLVEINNEPVYQNSMDTFQEKVLRNDNCLNQNILVPIKEIRRDDEGKMLHVLFANGVKSRFLYVWLRDNCPEKHTYNLSSICKARIMIFKDLDIDIEPIEVKNFGDKIYVLWPGDKSAYYDSDWLQSRNLDDPLIRQQRAQIRLNDVELWNNSSLSEKMKWISFDKIMEENLTLHDTLTDLCKSGIIFIDNVPTKLGQLQRLASKIGFEYLTHYGHFFMVKSDPNPTNVAYRSGALGFHTDLPYLQYAPQVQALHCIKQVNTSGGENQFVDGFTVAKQMAVKHPDLFKILCTVPFEYIDDGEDHIRFDLTYSRPVFNFDSNGRLVEIHFSNQQRSWFYDVPMEKLHQVYRAQKVFNNLLCSPENSFELKLQPGQMIIFHNLRVMHARSAFKLNNESSRRLLEGCYFNMDIIKSKIRVLRDQLNLQPNQISV